MENHQFENLQYVVTQPSCSKEKRHPTIIFLHGAGTRGNDIALLGENPFFTGNSQVNRGDFPFSVFAPLCYSNTWFDIFEQLQRFVKMVTNHPQVDSERVYLLGTSMGGYGAWQLAMTMPDTFSAIVPICGGGMKWNAAYYSEQLSQNVRRGMKTSAQKGQYTGGTCPLGYTITADKKYEVDPKYAPVVRDIFQLYSEGKTITEIVKILNDRGLRTSRGHAFTHNSLRTVLKNKKYIGTYEYNGEVSIENSVPPIVDVDVFNKVQDLLAFNQKAGAHKKAKVDYILFGKIFCGKCGAGMTGICGTSKQKVKHHYYICSAKKKKLCTKRAVRQDWIESLVLKHLLRLVRNEELLEFIAENTYQYFLAQNTDTTYTKSLQKALEETDRAINNLLRAIEAGIFNESTKDRMNELEEQKKDLRVALAAAKLKEDLALKKEHIVFFLHQFAGMDYSDTDCQKRLIKTFLNSVFVYDDKVVLTFNYSGDGRTITLHEIDGGLGHSICIPSAVVHQ